jgi:hypothetical protein
LTTIVGSRACLSVLSVLIVLALSVPIQGTPADPGHQAAKPVKLNLYFGDLHSHTGFSDGYGTPAEAYAAAKAAGADFLATTDHAKWISPEEWAITLDSAADATTRTFAALPACEYWLEGGLGELNVYGLSYLPPVWTAFGNKQVRLPNFYDWIGNQTGGSAQWNHPDYMTQTEYDGFGYYSPSRDRGMNVFEICNQGSYDWQGTTDWESVYIRALDMGWHIMPAANSDTHATNWISGYDVRTVLLAPSLSPDNLYAAMSACRGYATQDKNLQITYSVNGEVLGSILDPSTSTYTASVRVVDPDNVDSDAITMLELVADNGVVVASRTTHSCVVDWTVTFSSAAAHYFYLRVSTESNITGGPGVTAWTAPVWSGR